MPIVNLEPSNGSIRFEGALELLQDLQKYEQKDLKLNLINEFGKIAHMDFVQFP